MSRFVPLSSQEIILHAQSKGWFLETQKGSIMDFCPYPLPGSINKFEYLSSHKCPDGFDLLSKEHLYMLLRSGHQHQTPLWFYDLTGSFTPHAELNSLFFGNEMNNSDRGMNICKAFFCLIYDYVMSTNLSKSHIEPYIKNRDTYLDRKANSIGLEAFANIERDFPKRTLNSILAPIRNLSENN